MNSHLNVFKTYTRENRSHQLENDLTRSFAICMQEDALFFHEVLKFLFVPGDFELLLSNSEAENKVTINIQVNSKSISNFEKIIAVSLSDYEMEDGKFWSQSEQRAYDPVCDIVIKINETVIIIEAKRNHSDCTEQLYNQVFNIAENSGLVPKIKELVDPKDLSWKKLMLIAVRVLAFEKTVGNVNRFTIDFVNLVKGHNPHWLPQAPIASLNPKDRSAIESRIDSVINALDIKNDYRKLSYNDRIGLAFTKPWAQEILFSINENGDLVTAVYPGNTKAQGSHIFSKDLNFSKSLTIDGLELIVHRAYHIKFTSFQKYFSGLNFYDDDLKRPDILYNKINFDNYAGRNIKAAGDWDRIEQLFDECFNIDFDWRNKMSWNEKVLDSARTRFDLSFGYELIIVIPFEELKKRDAEATNMDGLKNLIRICYRAFEEQLIK